MTYTGNIRSSISQSADTLIHPPALPNRLKKVIPKHLCEKREFKIRQHYLNYFAMLTDETYDIFKESQCLHLQGQS
jgi:hypothetical protein